MGSYENVLPQHRHPSDPDLLAGRARHLPGPGLRVRRGGRKGNRQRLYEIRYKSSLSLNLGYTWYWGGGDQNMFADRDFAQAFVKYQF